MSARRREAILREMLRQERFGRLLGTQCWAEGYCAALAAELDGDVNDYYVHEAPQGQCHPHRCPLYFRHDRCQRTMPLYIEKWQIGWQDGRRWLEKLDLDLGWGVTCQVCGQPMGNRRALYCSPACKQRAYRQRRRQTPLRMHP